MFYLLVLQGVASGAGTLAAFTFQILEGLGVYEVLPLVHKGEVVSCPVNAG